jgi:Cu2+-exporting ATPase
MQHHLLRYPSGAVMRTRIIDVGGMLSALSARGVEKQLMKLPGIEKAEVNYVGGSATVIYDQGVIGLKEITLRIRECGYHCSGESLPRHVCPSDENQ